MKNILITCILFALSIPVMSQGHQNYRADRIKALKTAYITEKMDLSPGEAEKFWPLYNEYEEKESAIQKNMAKRFSNGPPDISAMSDQEVEELILNKFNEEKELVELRLEYYEELKEVLPVKKIFKLYEAEVRFRRELLDRLRDERKPHGRE